MPAAGAGALAGIAIGRHGDHANVKGGIWQPDALLIIRAYCKLYGQFMPSLDTPLPPDEAKLHVFSVTEVLSVTLIDNDRTVAVKLRRADGGQEAILWPRAIGNELLKQLRNQLEDA